MKVPVAILMSGAGSNARRLLQHRQDLYQVCLILSDNPRSNYRTIAEEFGVPHRLNDIYRFYAVPHPEEGLAEADRRILRDRRLREAYDAETDRLLAEQGVQLVATAGYDWIVSSTLCERYVMVNVHPGDLRVTDPQGRRLYVGLGWVPTARAILAGEVEARSSTHLVTAQLDGGPIARVSAPVPIPLPRGGGGQDLLPRGVELREIVRDVQTRGGRLYGEEPIVRIAKTVQARLKEVGDWVEFPRTLEGVAGLLHSGRLRRGPGAGLRLDGAAPPDLFLMRPEERPAGRGARGAGEGG